MFRNSQPVTVQRVESFVLLMVTLYAYHIFDGSWLVFALVLFTFDISMLGYLKSNNLGRITYNLGHTFIFPGLLVLVSYANDMRGLMLFALVWLAHISLDRTLGYGLKLDTFHNTHLGPIGSHNKNSTKQRV